MVRLRDLMGPDGKGARLWLCCFAMGTCSSVRVWILNNDIISVFSATDPFARDVVYTCAEILPLVAIALLARFQSSPDSCVKCYTMFLPFLLIKIDVFS